MAPEPNSATADTQRSPVRQIADLQSHLDSALRPPRHFWTSASDLQLGPDLTGDLVVEDRDVGPELVRTRGQLSSVNSPGHVLTPSGFWMPHRDLLLYFLAV